MKNDFNIFVEKLSENLKIAQKMYQKIKMENINMKLKKKKDLASISKFVAEAEKELIKEEEAVNRRTTNHGTSFLSSTPPQGSSPSNKILTAVKVIYLTYFDHQI